MPSLCWNRDAFRDAASLVSSEEGRTSVLCLVCLPDKFNSHVFAIAKVPACSTCVDPCVWKGGAERLGDHHEFTLEYDQGRWIGDDEIPSGENHLIQVLAVLTCLSNGVIATDEQPMASQEILETRGSRKTGANSKISTAAKVDHCELASLLAECPWAEEYL